MVADLIAQRSALLKALAAVMRRANDVQEERDDALIELAVVRLERDDLRRELAYTRAALALAVLIRAGRA